MVLEVTRKDGSKEVIGGEFTFWTKATELGITLSWTFPGGGARTVVEIEDYPTFNVGGTMAFVKAKE